MLSLEEYRNLTEQSPILVWRAGLDKLCNYFNERWLSFMGRTMEQELGNGWTEGVHPDDLQRCIDCYVFHFDRREIFEMQYRMKRHDGVYRWILDRGVPYYSPAHEFLGYIGSCIDITNQIEAEEALKRTREEQIKKLEALLPVCAWCKKIRSDTGYWEEIGQYFSSHGQKGVTHGICPECSKKMEL